MKRIAAILALALLTHPALAGSGTVTVKDSTGATQTFDVVTDASGHFVSEMAICDQSAAAQCATVTAGNAVKVDGSAVTQPVSGTVTANAGTNLNTSALALDTSVNGLLLGQASTTSGQKGPLIQGAGTTNSVACTTGNTCPLSLDTNSLLRLSLKDTPSNTNNFNVNIAASAATVTVGGTVSVNALPTGSNTIGKVDILGNAGAAMDAAGQNAASPANELLVGCQFNTSPTTISSTNMSPIQCTNAGSVLTHADGTVTVGGTVTANQGTANATPWNDNVAQIAGTATATGNGTTSAGTQRVTISSDSTGQVALATGSNTIGALTANQSVNVAQINGVTPLMGNGTTGTGSHRVTVSSDNSNAAGIGGSATGSAVPSAARYIGGNGSGNLTGVTTCDNWTAISQTSGTQIITGASSKKTYICSLNLVTATAQNVALVGGTGSVCATNPHAIAGGTTAATGWNFAANGGLTQGSGVGVIMQASTAADNLCILQSGAGQVSGAIGWTQF